MAHHARAWVPVASQRAPSESSRVVTASLRRAGAATFTCAAAVALDAITRAEAASDPLVLAGYSVAIWVILPAVLALAVVAGVAASRCVVLSFWSTSLLVSFTTAGWIAWGVGNTEGTLYGAALGIGGFVAGLASGRPWSLRLRIAAVIVIAMATAVVLARVVPVLAG